MDSLLKSFHSLSFPTFCYNRIDSPFRVALSSPNKRELLVLRQAQVESSSTNPWPAESHVEYGQANVLPNLDRIRG